MYELRQTGDFLRSLDKLEDMFALSKEEARDTREMIFFTLELLEEYGQLPIEFQDHVLQDEPWRGRNEYHVADDILILYTRHERRKIIRIEAITNHEELRSGKLL